MIDTGQGNEGEPPPDQATNLRVNWQNPYCLIINIMLTKPFCHRQITQRFPHPYPTGHGPITSIYTALFRI